MASRYRSNPTAVAFDPHNEPHNEQPDFPGLDQANVELTRDLVSAGPVVVAPRVLGLTPNELEIVVE